ncbi:MAG TPA: ribonuclease D, partial [Patescibacteria group bacterium]|nr:ribonuclease D [Patescibacteria group bacterium]
GRIDAPNLAALLADDNKQKLFFSARSQLKWIGRHIGIVPGNVYCVRIASRVARTYTQQHELDDISRQLIGLRISRDQQLTDWGAPEFTSAQLDFACNTVLHLHILRDRLDALMAKEGREGIARGVFTALPAIVRAELGGWSLEETLAE